MKRNETKTIPLVLFQFVPSRSLSILDSVADSVQLDWLMSDLVWLRFRLMLLILHRDMLLGVVRFVLVGMISLIGLIAEC